MVAPYTVKYRRARIAVPDYMGVEGATAEYILAERLQSTPGDNFRMQYRGTGQRH